MASQPLRFLEIFSAIFTNGGRFTTVLHVSNQFLFRFQILATTAARIIATLPFLRTPFFKLWLESLVMSHCVLAGLIFDPVPLATLQTFIPAVAWLKQLI